MNSRIDQLVRTLLQKDAIDHCSLTELKAYADRHPYFGAAQLLLTKKLQQENDAAFEEQLQKTLLFFHNPLWVEHLLNENGTAVVRNAEKAAAEIEEQDGNESYDDEKEFRREEEQTFSVPEEDEETGMRIGEEETGGPDVEITTEERDLIENSSLSSSSLNSTHHSNTVKIQESSTNHEIPLFEPYHTVDYFASQGIKLREEERTQDKFGQQLKSFTEWLKTMKRLPVTEIVAGIPAVTENKVMELAETSLQEREVLTEAMAEVWEKQGNHEKAVEIYKKLSLLEPSKSAYFAAKIEGLKK